jgi:hypothetical protein
MLGNPTAFRRRVLLASLLGAGLLIAAGVFTSPPQGDGTTVGYQQSLAAHPGATQVSAVLLHFGFLLLVPVAVGLLTLLRERAVALGHVAAIVAVVGAVTLSGNVLTDIFDLALAENLSPADAAKASDGATAYPVAGLFIVPGFIGSLLGFTLLSVAVWRAGHASVWFPVTMGLGWVAFFAEPRVGCLLLLASLAIAAVRLRSPGRADTRAPVLGTTAPSGSAPRPL